MDRVQGKINDLIDPIAQLSFLLQMLGSAFSESFKGLITGSMSAQQALANLFQRTADHFADMAAQMIAHAIKMKVLGIALNFFPAVQALATFNNTTNYDPADSVSGANTSSKRS